MFGSSVVVFFVLVVTAFAAPSQAPPSGGSDGCYQAPVLAPVADPFRAPATRYGRGNRGIEYSTRDGQSVAAAASGVVAFAGPVAGRLAVSVDHDDGLRTTYTGLKTIAVRMGYNLRGGTEIGTARTRFHFGVRAGDGYLDPRLLFATCRQPPRLVPVERLSGIATRPTTWGPR